MSREGGRASGRNARALGQISQDSLLVSLVEHLNCETREASSSAGRRSARRTAVAQALRLLDAGVKPDA